LLLGLATGSCTAGEPGPPAEAPGPAAHDFTFRDVNPASATHGRELTLGALYEPRGVALNFLASWCTYCWEELPQLEKLHVSGQARIVGIAADEYGAPLEVVLGLIAKAGLTLPVLFVPQDEAAELERYYDHEMLPATYLIDPRGKIRRVLQGATPPQELRDEILGTLR
jgi:thiol-disulfide isomerase/thioredoxin